MDVSQTGWGIGFSIVHARFQRRVPDVENHTTKRQTEMLARWMLYPDLFPTCPFLINL
jgi:hypothetical protein